MSIYLSRGWCAKKKMRAKIWIYVAFCTKNSAINKASPSFLSYILFFWFNLVGFFVFHSPLSTWPHQSFFTILSSWLCWTRGLIALKGLDLHWVVPAKWPFLFLWISDPLALSSLFLRIGLGRLPKKQVGTEIYWLQSIDRADWLIWSYNIFFFFFFLRGGIITFWPK